MRHRTRIAPLGLLSLAGCVLIVTACQEPASQEPVPEPPTPADTASRGKAASSASAWQLNTLANPADGSQVVVLQRTAQEVRSHSTADQPILYIRCRGGTTDLYIDWHDYIAGSTHRVTIRLDRGATTRARMWVLSRSNVATFYPESPVGLLQELMEARLLFVEAEPYNTASVTAVFGLEGLADAIRPLRAACGW